MASILKVGRALSACAIVSLAGCAASGVMVSESQLSAMKPGETTEASAIQTLGSPTMRTRQSDGSVLLIYSYVQYKTRAATFIPIVGPFVGGSDMRSSTVTLRFDPSGKLIDTTSSESAYGTGSGVAAGNMAESAPNQPRQEPPK